MSRASAKVMGSLAVVAIAVGAYVVSGGDVDALLEDLPTGSPSTTAVTRDQVDAADLETGTTQLARLDVAELEAAPGYEREAFGQRWADIDRNGCDQRNDTLRAGAREGEVTTKPGTHGCVVLEARIADPYTGREIAFVKGENTVDIDHIVPLSRAWQQGAAQWDEDRREEFANTPANLVAVDASANRSKGDSGPEEWLPEAGRCMYVVQWIDVKSTYELAVTAAEKNVLENELEACEGSAE
ncbi:HNH endonuclease family protein [Brachybacterium sp. J144]|uniref:HNH endonuclease family protein n=1 Tax=Brachybacterium sp. J144 TaxID=3116487 RepID=UPI002E78E06B|nr:HNH endonuclease family protein [Brachybacterium sp. J144]MEE1652139.1 HNH endonuclease family protein [Brachybacterium sp. J144]